MRIRVVRFVTAFLGALSMGMHLAHALELGPKLAWPAELYIQVQTSLYVMFGTIGPIFEVGTLIMASILALMLRGRRPAFQLTLVEVGAVVASLIVWLVWVMAANTHINAWAASGVVPDDWARWRDQWQIAQTATFFLHIIGLSALWWSFLLETRAD
jgi:hypothetical protein